MSKCGECNMFSQYAPYHGSTWLPFCFLFTFATCSQGIRIWSPPPSLSFKTKINLLNNFEGFFQLLTDVSQGLRRFSAKAVLNNSFQKLFQEEIYLKVGKVFPKNFHLWPLHKKYPPSKVSFPMKPDVSYRELDWTLKTQSPSPGTTLSPARKGCGQK